MSTFSRLSISLSLVSELHFECHACTRVLLLRSNDPASDLVPCRFCKDDSEPLRRAAAIADAINEYFST